MSELLLEHLEKLKEAMIEPTEDILNKVLNQDDNHARMSIFPKYSEILQRYDEDIKEQTQKYQESIIKQHRRKSDTITYCKKILKDSEIDAEERSIELSTECRKTWLKLRAKMEDQPEKIDWENSLDDMLGMSAKLEDDLMHVEIRLMQNLQEAMDDFKSRIDEINKTMDEETNKYFEDLEKFFSAYRDELLDHVKKVVDEF